MGSAHWRPKNGKVRLFGASDADHGWFRLPISRIEDLQDAVLGAGLDAVQLSRGKIAGGLAFSMDESVTFSSGLLDGQLSLTGSLSETMVTIGTCLHVAPGSRHWFNEVQSGVVGVFLPGAILTAIDSCLPYPPVA